MPFKKSYYANIPVFVDKVLPTLGNEKEQQQIKSYKKIWGELIFSRATKNLTNNLFQLPDWAAAQKLRLHYCYILLFRNQP